jgi:OOP family OmpA-OmpF porin
MDGDDDGDGVPNSIDKCPNTPAGAKVNSFGCQITESVNQQIDIEFQTGKSTIPADYTSEADKIVDMMTKHTDVNAEIQGYTDNVGSKEKNQKLSEARAKSVRNYIVKHGIDESRVTAKGYGEENPVAENSTADGRKQNRRVVASLRSK